MVAGYCLTTHCGAFRLLLSVELLMKNDSVYKISRHAGESARHTDMTPAEALDEIGHLLENPEYEPTSNTIGALNRGVSTRVVRFHGTDHTVHFEWDE
jgi:hypothetical protein